MLSGIQWNHIITLKNCHALLLHIDPGIETSLSFKKLNCGMPKNKNLLILHILYDQNYIIHININSFTLFYFLNIYRNRKKLHDTFL